jgi:lecithin-cholesterol acyltransferase
MTGVRRLLATSLAAAIAALAATTAPVAGAHPTTGLTPIVLFPAFHFTRLLVTVHDQRVDPACPRSGSFTDWFLNDQPSTVFSQVCEDELMTLRYNANPHVPMAKRFSNQEGVSVSIIDYGKTDSAPFYDPMYAALAAAGYTRDKDVRVAGYDARLTPDIGDFVERTKRLIEATYRDNGNRPVHLVGHSNGPIYAEYLLTHTSRAWKDKYIHGFTPIAGNFPGQGSLYPIMFSGLNIEDFSFPATTANALSSARMYLSTPSTYISSADPRIFGRQETVLEDLSTGKSYTPVDFRQIFDDAGLANAKQIAEFYVGFLNISSPSSFPFVDVYGERGSGIPTVVGAALPNLTVGQVLDPNTAQFFFRDGDVNQEDITNTAILDWQAMPCFRFSLTDNPGVDHFSLPSNAGVLARLIANANTPRSACR